MLLMGQDRVKKKKIRKPPLYLLTEKFWLLYYFKVHEKKICKEVTMFLNPVQRGLYFSPGPASPLLLFEWIQLSITVLVSSPSKCPNSCVVCTYNRYLKVATEIVTSGRGTVSLETLTSEKTPEDMSHQKRPERSSDVYVKNVWIVSFW